MEYDKTVVKIWDIVKRKEDVMAEFVRINKDTVRIEDGGVRFFL